MKPGWKTTEFWLSLITIIVTAVLGSGLLPEGHWITKAIAAAAAALASAGYAVARGNAKRGADPLKSVVFLVAGVSTILGLSACASLPARIEQTHYAAKAASAVAEPAFRERCNQIAVDCGRNLDAKCEQLEQCLNARREFDATVKAIHIACDTAAVMSEVDEKGAAKQKLSEAASLLRGAVKLLAKFGLVPGGGQ